jgi:threonine/homoserine/homoserine lactone efflux protein
MTPAGFAVFAAAYFVAVASPGPGVAALVARVLARGPRGVWAFIAGYVAGDLVWFALAATGLALLAQVFDWLFSAIRYAGAAYLLLLAWKAWHAPARLAGEGGVPDEGAPKLFLAGLALTLGNPKVILFFLALLPSLVDLAGLDATTAVELVLLMSAILGGTLAAYALAAARARRLFTSPRALRLVNRGTGAVMAGAAVAVAAR